MTGAHHFNEVFFDQVRILKDCLVGEQDRGWYQIAGQLDYERSGIERLMSNYPLLGAIARYVQETGQSRRELVRHRLAQLHIEFTMGRFLVYKVAWLLSQGVVPNAEAAAAKAYCTEFEQRLAQAASESLPWNTRGTPLRLCARCRDSSRATSHRASGVGPVWRPVCTQARWRAGIPYWPSLFRPCPRVVRAIGTVGNGGHCPRRGGFGGSPVWGGVCPANGIEKARRTVLTW